MSISADETSTIAHLATHLLGLTEAELSELVEKDGILKDTFLRWWDRWKRIVSPVSIRPSIG